MGQIELVHEAMTVAPEGGQGYATRPPLARDCVIRYLLEDRAAELPDQLFAIFDEQGSWTFAQALAEVRALAGAISALGVAQGDHVMGWLPNGRMAVATWLAVNYLGAVYVPVNIAYKGGLLENAVAISGAKLAIVHGELAPRLTDIDVHALQTVVVVNGEVGDDPRLEWRDGGALKVAAAPPALDRPLEPWDPALVIFTSGTTGKSKGVVSSYGHLFYQNANGAYPALTAHDRYMIVTPLFHASATGTLYATLVLKGSFALFESFKSASFWESVRKVRATSTVLLGVMVNYLLDQPARDDDRDHTLSWFFVAGRTSLVVDFEERFGARGVPSYSMTEIATPLTGAVPVPLGSCGRPRSDFELRLVDRHDVEVPHGQPGELIIRAHCPWSMMTGYKDDPAATATAWRNGWFHTGDVMRRDEDGNYFYVDRLKDSIRRRGENISSQEVEAEAARFSCVSEVVVIGVPDGGGEDEVMACVTVLKAGDFVHEDFVRFLATRLPHFMIPRYVRILDEIPKTPSNKVQKSELREQGVTHDTWDREAVGLLFKREKLR